MKKTSLAVVAAFQISGCLTDSPKISSSNKLIGTWRLYEPYISANRLYQGYSCFLENGEHHSFDLSYDTLSTGLLSGMQWHKGNWYVFGDSLETKVKESGKLFDINGIGTNWESRITIKSDSGSGKYKYEVTEDSLFRVEVNARFGRPRVTAPSVLRKYCN